jgi:hypothetical protein
MGSGDMLSISSGGSLATVAGGSVGRAVASVAGAVSWLLAAGVPSSEPHATTNANIASIDAKVINLFVRKILEPIGSSSQICSHALLLKSKRYKEKRSQLTALF